MLALDYHAAMSRNAVCVPAGAEAAGSIGICAAGPQATSAMLPTPVLLGYAGVELPKSCGALATAFLVADLDCMHCLAGRFEQRTAHMTARTIPTAPATKTAECNCHREC